MSTLVESPVSQRRRRRYIDAPLQGQLVWWLVAFEVAVFAAAMVLVYFQLDDVITSHLYRIHATHPDTVLPPVLDAVLMALPWILVPNALLILVLARRWARRVVGIVAPLDELFAAAQALDLRARRSPASAHEVLMRVEMWQQAHRTRCATLRRLVGTLEEGGEVSDAERLAALRHIQRVLP